MSQYKGLSPVQVAQVIRARQSKWGKMGASSAAIAELEETVIALLDVVESYEGGLNKDEATKLRRQLAAANARVARQAARDDD